MNILIVLLGCNLFHILNDRVNTAVDFAIDFERQREIGNGNGRGNGDDIGIIWFLSGGIKYGGDGGDETISEAERMMDIILREREKKMDSYGLCIASDNDNWNFILDTNSTNTAENFIMVNKLLMSIKERNEVSEIRKVFEFEFEKIYVVTSKYHHKRAKLIADSIHNNIYKNNDNNNVNHNNTLYNWEWILAPLEERKSEYWENIHIRNAEKDVSDSMKKFNLV